MAADMTGYPELGDGTFSAERRSHERKEQTEVTDVFRKEGWGEKPGQFSRLRQGLDARNK